MSVGAAETTRDQSLGVEKVAVEVAVQPYSSRAEKQKEGIYKSCRKQHGRLSIVFWI